jgi:hypothetical protein
MQAVGYLAAPLRFHREVPLGGSYDATGRFALSGRTQRGIAKLTNLIGFAIYGAALLAGFYHRSVLRCGCLAERGRESEAF